MGSQHGFQKSEDVNDRIADTTITIGADFSGAEREAAKFQKSAEAASVAVSNTFRLVTRNSEAARASLAKVNAETELFKRRTQVIVDDATVEDFRTGRRSIPGRIGGAIAGAGVGAFTGPLGPAVAVPAIAAGATIGFFSPEAVDKLQLAPQAEVKALLSAVSDLEGTLEVGREVLAETASQLCLPQIEQSWNLSSFISPVARRIYCQRQLLTTADSSKTQSHNDTREHDCVANISHSAHLGVVTAAWAVECTGTDLPTANRAGS